MPRRPLFAHLQHHVGAPERTALLAEIASQAHQLRRVESPAGIRPQYSVLGGTIIDSALPRVAELGERVRTLVEAYAGMPLEAFHDPIRRARVQVYTEREDGFRWHFDEHQFVALVTLENESGGMTELISPRVSTFVRPLFYPAYLVPRIFSVLPRTSITAEAGDVVMFSGSASLHRGRSRDAGRRTILVFAFDPIGRKRSRLKNWIARHVNY